MFKSIIIVSAISAMTASARINGMSIPSGVSYGSGDKIPVSFKCGNSLTNNEQYGIAFGSSQKTYAGTIGYPFYYKDISSMDIPYAKPNCSFVVEVEIPSNLYPEGATSTYLSSGVFGVVGASGGLTEQVFNVTVPLK